MKIAVIGAGISGLSASHYLDTNHEVTLFEARDYAGGHTNTVEFEHESGTVSVDTGFIVYNERTYPRFIELLNELGVESEPTTMSFSVRSEPDDFEYAGENLNTLFADRTHLFRPGFYRMIADILRFNWEARMVGQSDAPPATIGEFLSSRSYSDFFVERYLIPMAAAIWSSPRARIYDFPFETFVNFFDNHGLLQVLNRPTWHTLKGGGRAYVQALLDRFTGEVRLSTPVQSVEAEDTCCFVETSSGRERFDAVVMAVHSDQALQILSNPTSNEREILGSIDYESNSATLHTDPSVLPDRRRAWSAWNVLIPDGTSGSINVTYNMNILQHIERPDPLCVSLNLSDEIDSSSVIREFQYDHPVYDRASNRARDRWNEINGARGIYYAGAYWRYGFHEDGVLSAQSVVSSIEENVA